ncbi:ribosomal protein S18-alanine N-acetyltransferase [uncultured Selenomonas sp.]|uniref:ribosomal protein S18-alanine N-acetyltransferase n=1 Tax=uncultured Selenomonas sp. TaxID=159275 RepID=UPI0028EC6F95|nr:ribosomal protein S18-alanine N-acetyltransferase [uncultured Selenomonas sp.]
MIHFRDLLPEDAEAVANIERESFPTPWSREDFWREASNDFACYIVALDDAEIIGFGGCWISFEEAQVTNIALTSVQRGRGLGKALMARLMRAAATRGAERMTLEVRPSNTPALRLYEGLGFAAAGIRKKYYQDNDEDAILMWHTKLKEFVNERCAGETDARD